LVDGSRRQVELMTVGSSPRCSSPTSAAAIAARIASTGRVWVSEYRLIAVKSHSAKPCRAAGKLSKDTIPASVPVIRRTPCSASHRTRPTICWARCAPERRTTCSPARRRPGDQHRSRRRRGSPRPPGPLRARHLHAAARSTRQARVLSHRRRGQAGQRHPDTRTPLRGGKSLPFA